VDISMARYVHSLSMVALLLFSANLLPPDAAAQQPSSTGNGSKSTNPNWPPKKFSGASPNYKDYASTKLKDPPVLPGLPKYPGQLKYIQGLTFPSVGDVQTTLCRYLVKDPRDEVRDWYIGAFRTAQWGLQSTAQSNYQITATNQKLGVLTNITLHNSAAVPGYKSEIYVRYIVYPQKH
jgi:hypothetical protein